MAHDEALAARFRAALEGLPGISEKRMMGGVCFLLNGNMIGGIDRTADGRGRFLFRVGKENEADALTRPGAEVMRQGGKRMSGLIFVDADACPGSALADWVSLSLGFVSTLPPK